MITEPGKEITWGELHVGPRQAFADAGFQEITHPTPRRVVMRIDLTPAANQPGPARGQRAADGRDPPRRLAGCRTPT